MTEEELDRLEQSLDVTRPTLELGVKQYREATGLDPAVEPASFLGYLRRTGVINAETYRRASADEPVRIDPEMQKWLDRTAEQYDVFEKIAEGGMGEIRVARDRQLRHTVAIKLLKDGNNGDALSRFITEAQVTAQLDHPNIVPVYSLQSDSEGRISFSMKMVVGKTFKDLIREVMRRHKRGEELGEEHALPRRLEHFLKVCDAVSYAHSKGVLHRDLKPTNVMVGAFNEVYVMDWGIAKMIDDDATPSLDLSGTRDRGPHQTRADQLVGTPAYMSPEQAEGGGDLDERSDLYSLGLILYELTTLRRAIKGEDTTHIIENATYGRLNELSHRFPGQHLDRELIAIIRKATEYHRGRRYQKVEELAEDLRRYLRGDEVMARPDNSLQRMVRWMGKHRQTTLMAVLAILLVSATAVIWSLRSQKIAADRARVREARLTRFQSAVAAQAHEIDRHFLFFEGRLIHLAAKASSLLEEGTSAGARLYSNHDYDTPGRGPPDLAEVPVYRKKVSFMHPVYVLAPGVELDRVSDTLAQLSPLGKHFRWMLDTSAGPGATRQVGARELPLRWVYVGLESGIFFAYPGKGGYPSTYDPRTRPWYSLGRGQKHPTWGNPYIDLQGQGLVLPGAMAVRSSTGEFLGVAGMELPFDHIIRHYLQPKEGDAVIETFLLDARGRVVVSSRQLAEHHAAGQLHSALELRAYPHAEIAERVARGESGQRRINAGGKAVLASYQRIPSLDWSYLVHADLEALLR